jgi:hypothetical protein
VIFNKEDRIIEVLLDGDFDWSVIEKVAPEIAKINRENGCNLILRNLRASA